MALAVKILVPIAIALITTIVAYLLNQFTELKNFSGKLGLLVRLTLWLTLGTVALQVIYTADDADAATKHVFEWIGAAVLMALAFDGWTLATVLLGWRAESNWPEPPLDIRERLLQEHHRTVRRRLDYAVGEQALINLVMEPQPERVVGRPQQGQVFLQPVPPPEQKWNVFKLIGGKKTRSVLKETILETFDNEDIGGRLLILGQPGSGKTTTMLKLADALLERAKTIKQIPYIFELSAWRNDEQKISDWLIAQLKFDHNIDPKLSREWLAAGHMIPLLDGLDELGSRQRKCIDKINEFVQDMAGQQVVVCCRTKEYGEGGLQLKSLKGGFLYLQPLEDSQIRQYFEDSKRLDIWEALQNKPTLNALLNETNPKKDNDEAPLLRIPLFLQILAVAYQPGANIESKPDLFDAYIARRLRLETREWDRSLALSKDRKASWAYTKIEDEPDQQTTERYICWLAKQLRKNNIPNNFLIEQMQPSWLETFGAKSQYLLISNLLCFIALGSPIFLVSCLQGRPSSGLAGGFLIGLFPTLIGASSVDWSRIARVEIFRFSSVYKFRRKIMRRLSWVLPFNAFGGWIIGVLISTTSEFAFLNCFLFAFISLFFLWLLQDPINHAKENFKVTQTPNQGILASGKNFLLFLIFLYFLFFIVGFTYNYFMGEDFLPNTIGNIGLLISPIIGFYVFGGLPVVQHVALRFTLYSQKHTSWNYARLLKYTTERRLTQQIGGSFRFIHRELLDHFAAMEPDQSETS